MLKVPTYIYVNDWFESSEESIFIWLSLIMNNNTSKTSGFNLIL